MAGTDEYYRRRLEDYPDYADYQRDQDQFKERLYSDRKVLFDTLSNHKHDEAAQLLGIPPEIVNSLRASFATASWSLRDEINELVELIDATAVIDDSVKMHWMSELEHVPDMKSANASERLVTFCSTLMAWKTRFKAERRLLNLGLSSEMNLERDISSIARKTLTIIENIHRS